MVIEFSKGFRLKMSDLAGPFDEHRRRLRGNRIRRTVLPSSLSFSACQFQSSFAK